MLTNSIPLNKYLLTAFRGLNNVSDTTEEAKKDSYYPEGVCNFVEELPLENNLLLNESEIHMILNTPWTENLFTCHPDVILMEVQSPHF